MRKVTVNQAKKWASMVDIGERNSTLSGGSGAYYKINDRVGIKIYHRALGDKAYVRKTDDWKKASRALKYMNIAAKHGLAPKGYAVMPIRHGNDFRVGLVMQHAVGRQRSISRLRLKTLEWQLRRCGLLHDDLGEHNWKVRGKKIIVLDWDYAARVKKAK